MIMEYVVLLYCLCEGELQDVPVLLLVHLAHPHGGLTQLPPPRVAQLHPQQVLEPGGDEGPGAHVAVLLLRPHPALSVGVGLELILQSLGGEGAQALQSDDGHVGDAVLLHVLGQSVVMLP